MSKLEELKKLCNEAPLYPYKKWPVAFVQYPEVNQMLDFALDARTAMPVLIEVVERQREALKECINTTFTNPKLELDGIQGMAGFCLTETQKLLEEIE